MGFVSIFKYRIKFLMRFWESSEFLWLWGRFSIWGYISIIIYGLDFDLVLDYKRNRILRVR